MGKITTKSNIQIHKSIAKKSDKLLCYLLDNEESFYGGKAWNSKRMKLYGKLFELCEDVLGEIENFDEVEEDE